MLVILLLYVKVVYFPPLLFSNQRLLGEDILEFVSVVTSVKS